MCTIGNVKSGACRLTFKQCDLPEEVLFYAPEVQTAIDTGIRYVAVAGKKVSVDCDFVINGNPASGQWKKWKNIFG